MTKLVPAIAMLSMTLVAPSIRGAEPNIDLGKDILPILSQKCQQCHGGIHKRGGLDLRSLDAMLKGGQSGPAVKLGSPDDSLMWKMISSDKMPQTNLKLTAAEKKIIHAWISAGAKEAKANEVVKIRESARSAKEVAAEIDQRIQDGLKQAKVEFGSPADDSEFLRRVYLDIIGRIPTIEEAKEFLADRAGDKRARLIDNLLARPEYGKHLAETWVNIILQLAVNASPPEPTPFTNWMAEQLNQGVAWNKIVHEMISATAEDNDRKKFSAPVLYYLFTGNNDGATDTVTATSNTSQIFLGIGLQCAECHDHPFQNWKQTDYWGMAAFFARLSRGGPSPKLTDLPVDGKDKGFSREVSIFSPEALHRGKKVNARFPGGDEFKPQPGKDKLRFEFANWMSSRDNPYFARTYVNRVWGHFFGRGFVNSYTDFNDTNPPSHPKLLSSLSAEFVASNFDHKHLIRSICLSQTYQRTGRSKDATSDESPTFARMESKVLSAEMLYASLCVALDVPEISLAVPPPKNSKIPPPPARGTFVAFVRGMVRSVDSREYLSGVPQSLRIMNQADFNHGGKLVERLMARHDVPEKSIADLFLAAYSRPPRKEELEELRSLTDTLPPKQAYERILWVLLNSSEFRIYH